MLTTGEIALDKNSQAEMFIKQTFLDFRRINNTTSAHRKQPMFKLLSPVQKSRFPRNGFSGNSHFPFVFLILIFLLPNSPVFSAGPEIESSEQYWQTVWNRNERIGYAQSTRVHRKTSDGQIVVTDTLLFMTLKRFGQTVLLQQRLHVEETIDGYLQSFSSVTTNPPNSQTILTGVVRGDELLLTTQVANKKTSRTLTGMSHVYSPLWPERFIRRQELKHRSPVEFSVFEPQLASRMNVKVEYLGRQQLEGRPASEPGLREVLIHEMLPGSPAIESRVRCEEDWSIKNVSTPLLNLELRTATESEALEPLGVLPLDFAMDTMVVVKGVTNIDRARQMTFRLTVEGANPSDIFKNTGYQSIQVVDEHSINLTISSAIFGPSPSENRQFHESHPAQQPVAEDLNASQYLDSQSPLLLQLGKSASLRTKPLDIALDMEKFVKNYVSDKNFSTAMATATEVAASKAGDCTEHAVLLAALLRTRNIPSRVAIGFVYSPKHQAFVGHMWTEAWLNDTWFPLDATLGQGGTGCGYITVSTSNLADSGSTPTAEFLPMLHLLGRTRIELVGKSE